MIGRERREQYSEDWRKARRERRNSRRIWVRYGRIWMERRWWSWEEEKEKLVDGREQEKGWRKEEKKGEERRVEKEKEKRESKRRG